MPDVIINQGPPPEQQAQPETPPPPKIVKKKPPVEPKPEPQPVVAKPKPKAPPQPAAATQQAAAPQSSPPPSAVPQPPAPGTALGVPTSETLVKISPVGGSEIPVAKVPNAVGLASAADIQRTGAVQAQDVLQTTVPGVIVTDLQGNGFQTNVQYRGFESSPVNGVPQGIAVYQNGVRINESFGDVVNWDFLPSNAISDIAVISNNPVFGLNAIGGAASITLRDGFTYQGTEFDVRGGSFGRIQGGFQTGQQSGPFAAYFAFEDANDDGWRESSPSTIRRLYGDIGFRTKESEFHINFTDASNFVGAVAAAPVELLAADFTRVYTSPQLTNNYVRMVSGNGAVAITDDIKVSGVIYHRTFQQRRQDANVFEAEDCGDTTICLAGEQVLDGAGNAIPFDPALAYGTLDLTSQNASSFGGALQAVDKSKIFGLPNQFLIGASYDNGTVGYTAASQLGAYQPRFVLENFGTDITAPADISPRNLTTSNDYFGVYFSDTLDITDRLAVTVGGRFNYANLQIRDNTGNDPFLNSETTFTRFNPQAGATYKLLEGLTLYGGYAEANRAPTPAELACSDPDNPCLIESFLTADPPLRQVVTRSGEVGFRGEDKSFFGGQFAWSAGYFRALNSDDIISIAAPNSGRGFFQNAGETLRQGVEIGTSWKDDRVFLYANYSFVDATFNTAIAQLPSPNSPSPNAFTCAGSDPANPLTCVAVEPGDRLPGIPEHKVKAGFDYWITPQWKFGADLVYSSNQIFEGDQGNDNAPLPGYTKVDLHSSYDVNKHLQLYGLVNNLFDTRYGLFGNYFDLDNATQASLGEFNFTDPRTIVPGAPFAIYGGVKLKY